MIDNSDDLIQKVLKTIAADKLKKGLKGIEKESLRIADNTISRDKHPKSLGSSLCHSFITTDFSEAQLELVTPPINNNEETYMFLDNIHHFVSNKIKDELIWPHSIPPSIDHEANIPIAFYGKSDKARFKHAYRNGLANRYGKLMQAISGIHFNYSLPDSIWPFIQTLNKNPEEQEFKSLIYFRGLRNIQRLNWLILYFFGASPIVSNNFDLTKYKFSKLNGKYYYLPYATSLRMSDLGYQNLNQSTLNISLNSLEKYASDIKDATEKESREYKIIDNSISASDLQINSNILQTEDEYYSISRPKSNDQSEKRLATKLSDKGIDYIEYRSLDLDPYSRTGISIQTINFLEVFCIYSFLAPSPFIDIDETNECKANDLLVATKGRDPNLTINRNGKSISIKDWGNQILDELEPIAELFGSEFLEVRRFKKMLTHPELTTSGKILTDAISSQEDYFYFSKAVSLNYKNYYRDLTHASNAIWDKLISERDESLKLHSELPKSNDKSYKQFISEYFDPKD